MSNTAEEDKARYNARIELEKSIIKPEKKKKVKLVKKTQSDKNQEHFSRLEKATE